AATDCVRIPSSSAVGRSRVCTPYGYLPANSGCCKHCAESVRAVRDRDHGHRKPKIGDCGRRLRSGCQFGQQSFPCMDVWSDWRGDWNRDRLIRQCSCALRDQYETYSTLNFNISSAPISTRNSGPLHYLPALGAANSLLV